MLFVLTISDHNFERDDRIIPVAAYDEADAIMKANRIIPNRLFWSVESVDQFIAVDLDTHDALIEAIEAWWGEYTDYAEGNDNISDAEYQRCVDLMHASFDAAYDALYD